MIAVDTSALIEIALDGREADFCSRAMEEADHRVISAGTLAEVLIVSRRRSVGPVIERLLDRAAMEIIPVTEAEARRVADAYDRWGKGVHPAGLNLGDCFSYAVAHARGCPLLFIGDDFARTDITRAD